VVTVTELEIGVGRWRKGDRHRSDRDGVTSQRLPVREAAAAASSWNKRGRGRTYGTTTRLE